MKISGLEQYKTQYYCGLCMVIWKDGSSTKILVQGNSKWKWLEGKVMN